MLRKAFSIHSDYYKALKRLSSKQHNDILLALILWAECEEIPQLDDICLMLFELMTEQMERISAANSENGKKGGRPPKTEKSKKTDKKPIKPSVTVSDSVSDSVSVSEVVDADIPTTSYSDKAMETIKSGRVALSATEYKDLLSEYGEDVVNHYIGVVNKRCESSPHRDNWQNWNDLVRKAITEKLGGDAPKQALVSDYTQPFKRRKLNG